MENQNVTLIEEVQSISDRRRKTQMKKLDEGFESRKAFEATHAPNNTSIQKKLTSVQKRLVLPGIAALTLATNVDADFMNSSGSHEARRYNIYAIDKLADLLHGLNDGHIRNAVNKAIVASLLRFGAADVAFTGVAAQGAVSQNLAVEKEIEGLLVRHTASPGTAPTQSSSTMSALMTLGAVENIGNKRHPIYKLTDTPVVGRLKEIA